MSDNEPTHRPYQMKTIDLENDPHMVDDHFEANELQDELEDEGGLMRLLKPLGWLLLGVVVMVAIVLLTLTWRGSSKRVPQLTVSPESEQRVDALDERLSRLETAQAALPSAVADAAGADTGTESDVRMDQLSGRMDRLEALVTEQFEKVEARLDELAKDRKRAATKPPAPTAAAPKPAVKRPAATGDLYTVKDNDTLYGLSTRFGVSVDQLKKLNNLTDNTIRPGQTLRVK